MSDQMVAAPASRTEFVLATVRRMILTGELAPGQQLVETELAERFGVSKTPVREALKTLAGSGLVTMSQFKGASVRIVDADMAYSVYDLRLVLEPAALARAVRAGAGFDKAAAELEKAAQARSDAERSMANRDFHRALYAGCGNPLMVQTLDGLRDQAALITVAGWGITASWRDEAAEHAAILAAARKSDAAQAAGLLQQHIQSFIDRVFAELPG
ncbi:GntR family transcriptional regulator [Fodinicola acaciae]|uniref:GntR family transcriptional regulator n=1 Tax=Fodinicola acaciae TaxID=2681555 RepID=UPI001C9E2B7A|nr:GntR family transcriptional regulator [Fodinicola acaciae]